MSASEPIRVELSAFEKLAILRAELDERMDELEKLEATIREELTRSETQRYLESLGPYYASNRPADLPTSESIQSLEDRRAQLKNIVTSIEAMIPEVMKMAEGKEAPAATGGGSQAAGSARKARFDSFDDFKKAQS